MFTKFSHVGIVVHDLDAAVAKWGEQFGLHLVCRFTVEEEGVESAFMSSDPEGRTAAVELLAPLPTADPDDSIPRRLRDQGEGVYHLCFLVDDTALEIERLRELGATVFDLNPALPVPGRRIVIHPNSANGALIELLNPWSPGDPLDSNIELAIGSGDATNNRQERS